MRRYTWKLAIAFVFSYALLMVVVFFAYTEISTNFIQQQAQNNLMDSGDVMATRLDSQLAFEHQRLSDLIDYYESLSLDPITALYDDMDEILIFEESYVGFGTTAGRDVTIDGTTYTYVDALDINEYDQRVTIYTFNEAFGTPGDTTYVFIRVGSIVGYFEAEPYFNHILEFSSLKRYYAIMSQDNVLNYQSFPKDQGSFFYPYLRSFGVSELTIDRIALDLMNVDRGIVRIDFLDLDAFMTYNPLSVTHSVQQYYLVQVYDEEEVIDSMSYLTNILTALFFVIFVLFAGGMVLLYKILESKVNDIEDARIVHYYAKPYIVRIKASGSIKSYNQSFKKLLGDYDIYDHVRDFKIKKDYDMETLEEIIHRQRAFTAIFDLGVDRTVYVRFIPVRSTGGYVLIGDDISHIEGRYDEYRTLALFDKVTHLPNLNSLRQDLQAFFFDQELLEKKNTMVAVDIVSFSKINLLLGENSGNRFLVIFSEILDESLEGYPATLYNTESDTFVVFFKDIENYNWATRWINKVIAIFEKPITIDKNFINVDINMGVFNIETSRYETLNPQVTIKNMMLALNHAKGSAAHKYIVYDVSLSLIASRDQKMELDLATAIKNNEFYMALQPKYDNNSEKIIGFEALIRWKNPKYASESPLKFIQMAEKNNMIIDIGRIAMHETFQIAKEFEKYNVQIAVNVSPVQLLQAGFVSEVISIFEQYELKKHAISLEITETFLIGSFELVINKLKLLQKYGFDIHLDDFGTGYSSLQYLKDLPINTIKIDRAFVIDLETDSHSRAIVTMIASLAKNVGLNVVAEGIENERQNQIAFRAGCNIIQGYLLSPPVEKTLAEKLILDYNINKTKTITLVKPKSKEIRR